MKLTPKQEKFVLACAEGKTQYEAYRIAYNTDKMKVATIRRKACEEMEKPHVYARFNELQTAIRKQAEEKAIFTAESTLKTLKDIIDRNLGEDDKTALDGIKTAMKHLGMFIDKVEHSGEIKMPTIKIEKHRKNGN